MSLAGNEVMGCHDGALAGLTGYAQPLRAIGQALEVLNIQGFEMEPAGDEFFVRGTVPQTNRGMLSSRFGADKLRAIWGGFPGFGVADCDRQEQNNAGVPTPIELCYSAQDIERLEEEGRLRRGRSQTMADASSVSQILRCIGGYLNQKYARLLKITREGDSVAVEYETSLGSRMKETFAVRDLYDLWVRMYLQRQERTSP